MSELRWSKFWWQDYEKDAALRLCSLAAQGLWMRLLCLMHHGEPYGHLTVNGVPLSTHDIAELSGKPEKQVVPLIKELVERRVAKVTETGTLFCKRMVEDRVAEEKARENGKRGGNPSLKSDTGQRVKATGKGGVNHPDNNDHKPDDKPPLILEEEAEEEEEKEPPSLRSAPPCRGASDRENADFETFWRDYPRKKRKDSARKAFAAALKRASFREICDGLARQRWSPDPRFIPHPATWLNGGGWHDEPDKNGQLPPLKPDRHADSVRRMLADLALDDPQSPDLEHRRLLQ